MTDVAIEAGSFRDPRGRIFYVDERVLRTVMPMATADFDFVRSTGLVERLQAAGQLVGETQVDADDFGDIAHGAAYVLEHPRIPFISYPYEWTFSALQAAALLHLDIQQAALQKGVTLSDATAYNIQFIGPKPIFIDTLSFRRYADGEFWAGHRQFCEQFVNPLLLRAYTGVAHNAWFRGGLEGISAEDLSRVLPWRSRLSWNVLTNVFMQARLQKSSSSDVAANRAKSRKLPRIGFEQMLHGLRKWVARLKPKADSRTIWQDYAGDNSYADAEAVQKREFVADFCNATRPGLLFDIGCNTGDYSAVALDNGADLAIGFDFDQGALEIGYQRAVNTNMNFLPLLLDAANPSPAQGWQQAERMGLRQRTEGDAVIGLALVHHLAIAKNLPLMDVLSWLLAMAPQGVLEFVPKEDPMVQRLLQLRDDLFADYDQDSFESYLQAHARIVKSSVVSSSGRTLYWFDRA
jgi:ribosomal protein L11 methylase PrmA